MNITAPKFDLALAKNCAKAFAATTGLGCTVSDASGAILYERGYGCESCRMCSLAQVKKDQCIQSHIYGMNEAERFGGKYIYFCPLGLTCFVSPILGSAGSEAKITVGPFLMVEKSDYIEYDLRERRRLPFQTLQQISAELENVPVIPAEKVDQMSTLLFMATGFLNNVSAANRMLATQSSSAIQGQIVDYIMKLKGADTQPYPFEIERSLLRAIAQSDKPQAQKLLNELFGYIFFASGSGFEQAKSRIYELLVLISRTAIDAGADPDGILKMSHEYLQMMPRLQDMEALCLWLTGVMDKYMDTVFNYVDVKHADVIHRAVRHMRSHFAERITLEEMASLTYLSPAYFSSIFKQETGETFSGYLNRLRIDKSKELLLHENLRITDIAQSVGFDDQSYFTKVFKKTEGISPKRYRETKGGLRSN